MSAAVSVLQLCRAHFRRDDVAFASAAASLARSAKSPSIRQEIGELIRRGYQTPPRSNDRRPARPVKPPPRGGLYALPRVGFEDLLLEPKLQAFLDELVVELEYREELAERGLRSRNRLLFYGVPGNGKTASSAALANALGVDAYCVSIPSIVSQYLGGTNKELQHLFADISDGMVVVFDEIDAIGARRGGDTQAAGKEQNQIVTAMLTLLDRHRDGVIVATTNRPDILDSALVRRFDEQIEFPAPSIAQKRSLAERLAEKFGVPVVDVDDCQNFDHVTKTVEREARRAVMRELLAAEAAEEENDESPTTH